ncbi:MAG: alpha/beta hydrolase [Janthinobacterium lividum]
MRSPSHVASTCLLFSALAIASATGQNAAPGQLPIPLDLPHPGLATNAPYPPQPILQGGVVVPLYAPDSPYLKPEHVREAERYSMSQAAPGHIDNIVNIHNPSIEVHTVGGFNTGAAVILVAGGGHKTLNVGPEGADFVPFFANYGVTTIILRNRLRSDGYNVQTDAVRDAEQAMRLVRAHAAEWRIDPHKIGIMGFSAGAEIATYVAVFYDEFNKNNNAPSDPLAGISARPDFVGVVYPGPTPFANGHKPTIARDEPPSFIVCAGADDQVHAVWADEYFAAMLAVRVPNLEMHIYANGAHPGDPRPDGSHMSGGLSDRNGTPLGTWQFRFIDWFRDLGFLGTSGTRTKAQADIVAAENRPK